MPKLLNPGKALPVYGARSRDFDRADSLLRAVVRVPTRIYNAIFTPMGRRSVYYFFKRLQADFNPEYRKNGTLVYLLKNGSQFVLHRGNSLSELVYLEGAYEPLETKIVSRLVQSGDVVFDLGANVGYFTAILDRLVKSHGQVHAFEPGEETFKRLRETKKLASLGRSVLYQKAVGDSVGHVDFWSSTAGLDAQQNTTNTGALGKHMSHNRVESTTLDAFVSGLRARGVEKVAFVKCDIEGAEPSMLRGAQHLLNDKNPPIWLLEHNRGALAEHGATSQDLLAPFQDYDIYFTPLCWPPSIMASPQATRWDRVTENLPEECNLILLPRRGEFAKRTATLRRAGLLA